MKRLITFLVLVSIIGLILFPSLDKSIGKASAASNICQTSGPASLLYSATVCFTSPMDGATVTVDSTVTVTISVAGGSPGVQRVVFYVDGEYILTDYQSPYTFILPTARWGDGNRMISVTALMRDGFVTEAANISVNFFNNQLTPPINNKQFVPSQGSPVESGKSFTVAAAGDAASGEINAGKVSDLINSLNPNLFIYLGDVYEKGTSTEFYNWYGKTSANFGQFYSITNPTIGNHEYENGIAPGYFDYWNNIPDYYSYDTAGWHFISLNSNASLIGVNEQSPQYQWLQQDLVDHANMCTIVYYHHPLFNIGPEGATQAMSPIWNLMAQNGVDIVLNGHDHTYQRWKPLDANGVVNEGGITEFVAGASGHGLQTIGSSDIRVAYAIDTNPDAFGVLLLQLNENGANVTYHNIQGIILDSEVISCNAGQPDLLAPATPVLQSVSASRPTQVDLAWNSAIDDTGTAFYSIYRDDNLIANVPFYSLSFQDKTAWPGTTYVYRITASDKNGNISPTSDPAVITTPEMPPEIIVAVSADTYVNEANPAINYGAATSLRMDASPDVYTMLKFSVDGLANTPIARARIFLFSNTSVTQGINALSISDNLWNESQVTYANKPALGAILSGSGSVTAGTWVSLDVTTFVRGEGTFSFGITTPSASGLSAPSKESGANSAYLLLDLSLSGPDAEPPTSPAFLSAAPAGLNQIDLDWGPSSDNFAVAGYTLYRDNTLLAEMPAGVLSYSDVNVSPMVTYTYSVDAFDLAGFHSPRQYFSVSIPPFVTFTPVADTYVNADLPNNNFGTNIALRADATPDIHSYLKFDLSGLQNLPIVSAQLSLFSNSNSSIGFRLYQTADTSWGELTTTYANAPNLGSQIGVSGPMTANTPLTFDLSPYITAEGLYAFAFDTTSSSLMSLASRETGNNAPKLTVQVQIQEIDTQPPSAPTGLLVTDLQPQRVSLEWQNSVDNYGVAGYTIYRDGNEIANVPSSVLAFTDENVSPWSSYQYQIDAIDTAGLRSLLSSPEIIFTPDWNPPTTPGGFLVQLNNQNQAELSWNPAVDDGVINAYAIFRDGILLTSVNPSTFQFIDQTVVENSNYLYTIMAVDAAGNQSSFSQAMNIFVPDITPPGKPTGLNGTAISLTQLNLSWLASSDVIGVAAYQIYRDQVLLATVPGSILSYQDLTVSPGLTYHYAVTASDQAGNISQASDPYIITMPQPPSQLSFTPTADTYVNSGSPNRNYGGQTSLQAILSPEKKGYIKFNLQGLYGQIISKAILRVYSSNNGSQGIKVFRVPDVTWGESTTTYQNAPGFGSQIASTGSLQSGTWTEIDVTAAVFGEGLISFGINTSNTTTINLASRESGATSPQLVLTLRGSGPDTVPPSTPTGLGGLAVSPYQINLAWLASTDAFSVTGYTIYRNGSLLGTVKGDVLTYQDLSVKPGTLYWYTVDAFDLAGNHSSQSQPIQINSQPLPVSLTFTPEADTYVNFSKPTTNYGKQQTIKLDASPDYHGYMRFSVSGLYGTKITSAKLMVYVGSATTRGVQILAVSNNNWNETTVNYAAAPVLGGLINTSGPIPVLGWVTIDVTAYITQEGVFTFGLTTLDSTNFNISSRESGANAPKLILDLAAP